MRYDVLCSADLNKEEFEDYVRLSSSYLEILFGNLDDLKPCTVEIFNESDWAYGRKVLGNYCSLGRKMNLLYRGDKDDFLNTLVHEMNHQVLEERVNNPPRWLDEGLAQYHSVWQGKIIVGPVKLENLLIINQAAESHELIRLQELLNEDCFSSDLKSLAYAESWSFVRFLLDKRIFMHCVGKYALSRAFIEESEIKTLEQHWFSYLTELFKTAYEYLGDLDG